MGWEVLGNALAMVPLGRSEAAGGGGPVPLGLSPAIAGPQPEQTMPARRGDLRSGIVATAQALGMPPEWLATIISYETGGTFDPMQRGPTTQWGTHRGLIQFGEPQAREYGADFSSPEAALLSQLGPNGAIANYFRSRGWRPGMPLADAYSIVNAGAPGRWGASDANNGGAPGTVAEKVAEQFGGHMENALRLLGMAPDAGIADTFAGLGRGRAPAGQGTSPAAAAGMDWTGWNALAPGVIPLPPMIPGTPPANALAAVSDAPREPQPPAIGIRANDPGAFMQPVAPLPIYGFAPGTNPFY